MIDARKKRYKLEDMKKNEKLGLYLTPHAIMGYHGIHHIVVIGSRGRGKSVISLDSAIALKKKYGYENVKIFYFRLTDLSVKSMLANKAAKAIDPILTAKYDLEITCKNSIVYDHGKELVEFFPLVSAGSKGKGVNLYDANFLNNRPIGPNGKPIKRFIVVIWDEFLMAEGVEKKSIGDPVAQFKIYMEAIFRDQERLDYDAVRCWYLANSVSECANVTGALFNFIPTPNDFGIKKLTRKHCVFWNVPNSQAYLDKRKKSVMADIMDYENDANYTNVVKRDLDSLIPKSQRLCKVTNIIIFDKEPRRWFTVWDGNIIKKYNNQSYTQDMVISMKRYLDKNFYPDLVKSVFERFDARAFRYADLISQASFGAELKLIKNK